MCMFLFLVNVVCGVCTHVFLYNSELGDGQPLKPKVERERERERGKESDKGDHGRDADKEKEREKKHLSRDVPGSKALQTREKYISKPISELDLSNCEKCTPSYRLLPKSVSGVF